MGFLKADIDMTAIDDYIAERFQVMLQQLVSGVKKVADDGVALARSKSRSNGWTDHTGDLRNSIGYIISLDGKIVHENFETSVNGTIPSTNDPKKIGRDLAISVISSIPGIAFVLVAGMNYALKVESGGVDVITSAEQLVKVELPRMMNG